MTALASNIEKLRDYARTNINLTPVLKTKITSLITQYDSIKQFGGEDMNKNLTKLEKEVIDFMTTNNILTSYDGGRRRKSTSSSRHRRRSSKKRGTQHKQKRRQRRGSRRA